MEALQLPLKLNVTSPRPVQRFGFDTPQLEWNAAAAGQFRRHCWHVRASGQPVRQIDTSRLFNAKGNHDGDWLEPPSSPPSRRPPPPLSLPPSSPTWPYLHFIECLLTFGEQRGRSHRRKTDVASEYSCEWCLL